MLNERYFVSDDFALLDLDVIHGFLSTCYWSPGIARSRIERAVRNSLCIGAYERVSGGRPRQVGFARLVTDRATFAYLCDVFVLEAHRGQGISKAMMEAVVGHPELQGIRRLSLFTRDAHGVYAKFGFGPAPDPTRYMERLDREGYKTDRPEVGVRGRGMPALDPRTP